MADDWRVLTLSVAHTNATTLMLIADRAGMMRTTRDANTDSRPVIRLTGRGVQGNHA
jgi:hypothetical protein